MAELLAGIEGRFIVSLNDCPEVRDIFSDFRFADVKLDYTVGSGAQRPIRKVVILDGKDMAKARKLPLF
ncbi:hypothetical protein [Martelella mediterranea]|uniref:D12 class N6 adenine-specific DNA methyltransferase n=1 Tax=Martelella mediterranea TaxID=293089 RepID=A0A4R3NW82_9HYPH|nr:hypothetical protein [Martelella mediterranea]TCT42799.1 hypothetical protein EDC90_1004100 [Martelella mediterranea]